MLTRLISAVMSVVVFLSGAFPALFGGKEYINPDGDTVTVVDAAVANDTLIIKDHEAFKALGDVGVVYDEAFFNDNALAIITVEYQNGDEFYLKSICKNGTKIEVDYMVVDKNLTYLYSPAYKTIIVETGRDITAVFGENVASQPSFFKHF